MKFKSILRKLLVENTKLSKFEALYNKFVLPSEKALEKNPNAKGLISFDIFKQIIFADPDTKAPQNFDIEGANIDEMKQVKIGGSVPWIVKQYGIPNLPEEEKNLDPQSKEYKEAIKRYRALFLEDLFKIKERLEFYEKVKQYLPQEQRDINKLTSDQLKYIFANFKIPEKKQKEIEKKQARQTREGFKHAGGKIIFEGNDWVLIKIEGNNPTSKDAAIYYGGFKDYRNGESDWCTSGPGLSFFEGYIKNGPLYVIFPQNDNGQVGKRTGLPEERYQFHFPSNQFMDRHDKQIDLVSFLNQKAPELKELFKSEFAKGLVSTGGKKVEISYPNSSAGKYVAIYGFDDLFANLPSDIESLNVINTSNTPVNLDLPETIGRFTNLEALVLQNVVKTLPKSVGDLKNLSFISLPDNKNLVSLPDGLADLEFLSFINLKGVNPNIDIPERLKEKMVDQKEGFYYVM